MLIRVRFGERLPLSNVALLVWTNDLEDRTKLPRVDFPFGP